MEEDQGTVRSITPWVELEYSHMRALAGPDSHVYFTHLSNSSASFLSAAFQSPKNDEAEASCYEQGVLDLMKSRGIPLERVCLLDPKAEEVLSPEDGDGRFDMFLFGVCYWYATKPELLHLRRARFSLFWTGDDPPRDRTGELRIMGFPTRHLGPVQMTTDTALGVTKLVVKDEIPLDKISYVDFPTIRFNAKESVEMPFRYIVTKDGKEPLLPPGMKQLLQDDLNKGFDF